VFSVPKSASLRRRLPFLNSPSPIDDCEAASATIRHSKPQVSASGNDLYPETGRRLSAMWAAERPRPSGWHASGRCLRREQADLSVKAGRGTRDATAYAADERFGLTRRGASAGMNRRDRAVPGSMAGKWRELWLTGSRDVFILRVMIGFTTQRDRQDGQKVARDGSGAGRVKPGDIILWVENHLESWRQITHFISLAHGKKFDADDEAQFLELKGVIVQELEMILASGECLSPTKEDVHTMMNSVPSLSYISQLNDGALRNIEHQWHLIYIGWHAALGRLKVRHNAVESRYPRSGFLWSAR